MLAWRSVALAAAGSAAAVVAGPLIGLDPRAGVSISILVAFVWHIASSMRERDDEPHEQWVLLETYLNLPEAYLTRSVLEGSGIPTFLPEEHTAGARGDLVFAMKGVRLMVPSSELARARDLLASKGRNT
jgi:hypothetical protein